MLWRRRRSFGRRCSVFLWEPEDEKKDTRVHTHAYYVLQCVRRVCEALSLDPSEERRRVCVRHCISKNRHGVSLAATTTKTTAVAIASAVSITQVCTARVCYYMCHTTYTSRVITARNGNNVGCYCKTTNGVEGFFRTAFERQIVGPAGKKRQLRGKILFRQVPKIRDFCHMQHMRRNHHHQHKYSM